MLRTISNSAHSCGLVPNTSPAETRSTRQIPIAGTPLGSFRIAAAALGIGMLAGHCAPGVPVVAGQV